MPEAASSSAQRAHDSGGLKFNGTPALSRSASVRTLAAAGASGFRRTRASMNDTGGQFASTRLNAMWSLFRANVCAWKHQYISLRTQFTTSAFVFPAKAVNFLHSVTSLDLRDKPMESYGRLWRDGTLRMASVGVALVGSFS